MRETWQRRVERAEHLAADREASAPLLRFYAQLLGVQRDIFDAMNVSRPSGELTHDLSSIRDAFPVLLRTVAASAPPELADSAQQLLLGPADARDEILVTYWHAPSDDQFFGKAFVQPYANWLAERGIPLRGRAFAPLDNRCRYCGGKPQLAVLNTSDAQADGGGRTLVCATCLSTWPFPRVLCANCGETNEPRLGYFHSATYEHVRVEVCDTCRHYQKGVDRSRLGLAVPLVDDVATAALDLWAREKGYSKIEMNLVGL